MTFLSGARECRAAPQAPPGLAAHPDSSLCGVSAQLLQPPGGSRKPGNRFYPPVSISQASAPGPGGEPYGGCTARVDACSLLAGAPRLGKLKYYQL